MTIKNLLKSIFTKPLTVQAFLRQAMEGQPEAVAQAMECPGHGTPELPPPLAGERPEDVEKNVIAECIMRHYSGLKYMRKYAKILKINCR